MSQKAVTPQDIAESITPAETLVVESNVAYINAELLRQRFQGPGVFEVYLAGNLTEAARKAIIKPYVGHWRNPRIERTSYGGVDMGLWFRLESIDAPQE